MSRTGVWIFLASTVALCASPIAKVTEVISIEDLDLELSETMTRLEAALTSNEQYLAERPKLHLTIARLSVLAQALAESDGRSKLKQAAPSIRDAAIQFGRPDTWQDAKDRMVVIRSAVLTEGSSAARVDFDWSKLATTRTLMDLQRECTEQIRRSLRRPRDADREARPASSMAILAVAIAAKADELPNEADRPQWREWSMELQREMTLTSDAIRNQNSPAVLEHFKAAQSACARCHEKFKR